jgi:methenyltetrahydromethanopterin cyclohydrolase
VSVQHLNQRAAQHAAQAAAHAESLRILVNDVGDVQTLDFGVEAEGGLAAGLLLARICMSGLADVSLVAGQEHPNVPGVFVRTDHPVEACLQSQYAGWKIATDDYFAMGSGPMRALVAKEPLFTECVPSEDGLAAVGVLESAAIPTPSALEFVREGVGRNASLTLAVAPTASQSGTLQVVSRSVETAMHKLLELQFPVSAVISGTGVAPLPPVAKTDLDGIGRTNDAILYGATVNLWVRCDDELIETVGPQVPSSASASHGQTFLSLFKAANHDFYAMDKALFSPAVVVFHNLNTGRTFSFGVTLPDLLESSFHGKS